jgi:hypothetical protein
MTKPMSAEPPAPRSEQRIPFDDFLRQYGRTRDTGYRWRKRLPWLDVKNIFGRLYISLASVRRFEEMASRGELETSGPKPRPRRRRNRQATYKAHPKK